MKNNQKQNGQILKIPAAIQRHCGFADVQSLAAVSAEGVCVIHKGELTALELSRIIASLSELASDMTAALAGACGICDNCGDETSKANAKCRCDHNPARWVTDCSLCRDLLDESQGIHIPCFLLEEAGIPMGSKLEAYADEDSGAIMVTEADIQQDISDMPPGILSVLAQSGVCLAELDELIMREEIVYGK